MMTWDQRFVVTLTIFLGLWWPASGWAFHTWKRGTLSNGLTLVVVRQPDTPAVSLTLLIKRGASNEPPEKKGVASLTSRLLTEGTRQCSRAQLAERITALGEGLVAEVQFDETTLDWGVLKDDLDPALSVLADIVQHPIFPQDAVERARRAAIAELKVRTQETPEVLVLRHFFGMSPYGLPVLGKESSLEHLERQAVVQFHRQAYRPAQVILAAAGDLTFKELETLAEKYFGDWSAGEKMQETLPTLTVKREPAVLIVNRPLAQAKVHLVFGGAPAADPDTAALRLLASLLAGSPESRLEGVLRAQKGWTYSVSNELESFRQAGLFVISMSVPYEVILPAVEETLREIVRLRAELVSTTELRQAQHELVTRFYFAVENIQKLSHFMAKQEGLTSETPARVLAALRSVTAREVQQVARRYLDPQKVVVAMVGERQRLEQYAPVLTQGKSPPWTFLPPSEGRE